MNLWILWDQNVTALRPACARTRTFLWLVVGLAALTVRTDLAGGTSLVRRHGLRACCYHRLLYFFHSPALDLPKLISPWTALALRLFAPRLVRVGGRIVLLADGRKAPKEGRKMPAVKSLHQPSAGNTQPDYILGHSCQAVSILVQAVGGYLAVPLACRIHEGIVFSNRWRRSLLDKLVGLLFSLGLEETFYLVADADYASRKVARPLLGAGHHLVPRLRCTATADEAASTGGPRRRGRPKRYGRKIRLRILFQKNEGGVTAPSPVYGERDVPVRYRSVDLLWRPLGQLARFVLVDHPTRGRLILLSLDLTLDPLAILQLYGWRFKIEVSFKHPIHTVGTYAYHFWMKAMTPLRRGGGNQHLHHKSDRYRAQVRGKLAAAERPIQIGLLVQGLLQYLAVFHHRDIWRFFGSGLRPANVNPAPSERVVAQALRNTFPHFLRSLPKTDQLMKFLAPKLDPQRSPNLCLFPLEQAA